MPVKILTVFIHVRPVWRQVMGHFGKTFVDDLLGEGDVELGTTLCFCRKPSKVMTASLGEDSM